MLSSFMHILMQKLIFLHCKYAIVLRFLYDVIIINVYFCILLVGSILDQSSMCKYIQCIMMSHKVCVFCNFS